MKRKRAALAALAAILLASGFLLGWWAGRAGGVRGDGAAAPVPYETVRPVSAQAVPGAELLELHVYREEMLLEAPVPALRVQVKFRVPQRPETPIQAELHFKGDLIGALGYEWTLAPHCEMVEEHFGWVVYTYGYTSGGNTLSTSLVDAVVYDPHGFITPCVVYREEA